jgi:hypothetical protein
MRALALIVIIAGFLVNPATAASLKGTRMALASQNAIADRAGLSRIKNQEQLNLFKEKGLLVKCEVGPSMRIDSNLPVTYRWCRPETRDFLDAFAKAYSKKFPDAVLQLNSAVRTVGYQRQLRKKNGNAARADSGPGRSLHLTGTTVDITKKGMTDAQKLWTRTYLLAREREGKIDATEEKKQAVFHIVVNDPNRLRKPKQRKRR